MPSADARLVGDPAPVAAASHKKKVPLRASITNAAAAEAAADVITINIPSLPEKDILLGPVRHRLCEPLLRGKVAGGDTVWEGIGRAVDNASLSLAERMQVWDGVGVIGELARIKCELWQCIDSNRGIDLSVRTGTHDASVAILVVQC